MHPRFDGRLGDARIQRVGHRAEQTVDRFEELHELTPVADIELPRLGHLLSDQMIHPGSGFSSDGTVAVDDAHPLRLAEGRQIVGCCSTLSSATQNRQFFERFVPKKDLEKGPNGARSAAIPLETPCIGPS